MSFPFFIEAKVSINLSHPGSTTLAFMDLAK